MDFQTYALYAAFGLLSTKPQIVREAILSTILYVLNIEGYEVETERDLASVNRGVDEALTIQIKDVEGLSYGT